MGERRRGYSLRSQLFNKSVAEQLAENSPLPPAATGVPGPAVNGQTSPAFSSAPTTTSASGSYRTAHSAQHDSSGRNTGSSATNASPIEMEQWDPQASAQSKQQNANPYHKSALEENTVDLDTEAQLEAERHEQNITDKTLNAFAGKRGKWQKKFVDFKNLVFNTRPYKKSKNGRQIPLTVRGGERVMPALEDVSQRPTYIDERYEKPYLKNVITSARYTAYSFVPRQLYAQFSKVANVYFLTVSILQMIPSWSTTGTYTTIIPLLVFMTISILREGFDDWRRSVQDKKENNRFTKILMHKDYETPVYTEKSKSKKPFYLVARSISSSQTSVSRLNPEQSDVDINNSYEQQVDESLLSQPNTFTKDNYLKLLNLKSCKIKWKDIKVGDIIKLQQDEPVPADILLLTSDGTNENEVFIETMDLDGETNLKSRIPHRKISENFNNAIGITKFNGIVTTEDPNNDLYNFEGNININDETYPIGPENIIYRGSIIRNTSNLLGLVIFTGEETKIRMNAIKNPRTKAPKLQRYINMIVVFMVFVVMCLSLFSYMGQRLYFNRYKGRAWYLYDQDAGTAATIMSFIIMYNTLIPLSLYVTTEIIKVVQALFMHWDIDMYDPKSDTPCDARTATILEELGQVSYVFSDKTGTLTDNMMIFRKFSVAGSAWKHEIDINNDDSISEDESLKAPVRNSIDIRRSNTVYSGRPSLALSYTSRKSEKKPTSLTPSDPMNKVQTSLELLRHIQLHPNTEFSKKAKFFIMSLALCHTCLPKNISEDDDEEIQYQAASPDELAIVVAARDMGFVVLSKNHKFLTIRTYPNGLDEDYEDEVYEVLDIVEFTSSRKRMSIIIKFPNGKICLICKGADNIILERLRDSKLAELKRKEVNDSTILRKAHEAKVALQQRLSFDSVHNQQQQPRISLNLTRPSLNLSNNNGGNTGSANEPNVNSIDEYLSNVQRDKEEINDVVLESKKSLHLQQRQKYNIEDKLNEFDDDKLVNNEEYVLERTLEHIDDFSSEGLRTLLYGYRWLEADQYEDWSLKYASAKTSLIDRSKKIEQVGGMLENNLELAGATAIEDKLQEGVANTIDSLRRAGIKLWMLTGDKRETAINIGYSCKLIKDYSTLIILDRDDDDLTAKMSAADLEIKAGNVAHCVIVIDGNTLSYFENDLSLLSIFIELCTRMDSVIVCRASPSQKALMVTNIRNLNKNKVTLAIGDGANDIAMIQSADIGIGITGKEGLQAARSSDYSIAQFRYLQKLLLVHGRYNYVRTCKFVLSTFYKELFFYSTQVIFQRNTMFTGTSLYEPWSLSMFNTLFTSLPVLCVGMFEKDLKPATLLAVPELYAKGRLNQAFNLQIFIGWMIVGTCEALLISFCNWYLWGFTALRDNTLYPIGVLNFSAIVITINLKIQFLEMHNRSIMNVISSVLSCGGWLVWCCLLPGIYKPTTSKIYDVLEGLYHRFGADATWWACLLILVVMPTVFDVILQVFRNWFFPTEADTFRLLEKNAEIRKKIEYQAYEQMRQGWDWEKDQPSIKKIVRVGRKRKNTVTSPTELPDGSPSKISKNTSFLSPDGQFETEVLPSGKLIKRRVRDGKVQKLAKKLRFKGLPETDEDDDAEFDQGSFLAGEDADQVIANRLGALEEL